MCLSGTKQLAEEFGVSETLMKLISEGLMETPQPELRSQFQEPLFRSSVTSLEDIRTGTVLTGNIFILLSFKVNINMVDEMGKKSGNRDCNQPVR
jgi:transcriptional accessory protein Tex/SPT6